MSGVHTDLADAGAPRTEVARGSVVPVLEVGGTHVTAALVRLGAGDRKSVV